MRGNPEFTPDPGVLVCETFVRVRFNEVDALGHVNNAAYLNYLEQAAIDHATLVGLDMERLRRLGGVFVARRHEVTFLRPAHAGDVLRIVTWLGNPHGARVERRYVVVFAADVRDEAPIAGRIVRSLDPINEAEIVVRATTEWVFASQGGAPRRIPNDMVLAFRPDRMVVDHEPGGSVERQGD